MPPLHDPDRAELERQRGNLHELRKDMNAGMLSVVREMGEAERRIIAKVEEVTREQNEKLDDLRGQQTEQAVEVATMKGKAAGIAAAVGIAVPLVVWVLEKLAK